MTSGAQAARAAGRCSEKQERRRRRCQREQKLLLVRIVYWIQNKPQGTWNEQGARRDGHAYQHCCGRPPAATAPPAADGLSAGAGLPASLTHVLHRWQREAVHRGAAQTQLLQTAGVLCRAGGGPVNQRAGYPHHDRCGPCPRAASPRACVRDGSGHCADHSSLGLPQMAWIDVDRNRTN